MLTEPSAKWWRLLNWFSYQAINSTCNCVGQDGAATGSYPVMICLRNYLCVSTVLVSLLIDHLSCPIKFWLWLWLWLVSKRGYGRTSIHKIKESWLGNDWAILPSENIWMSVWGKGVKGRTVLAPFDGMIIQIQPFCYYSCSTLPIQMLWPLPPFFTFLLPERPLIEMYWVTMCWIKTSLSFHLKIIELAPFCSIMFYIWS